MIVVWGSKLYGKVDEIAGLGYVATQFGHLFWIPLIPMNSYFVTDKTQHRFEGVQLGLCWKSVLVGYARVFSVLFLLAGFGAANALFNPTEALDPARVPSQYVVLALGVLAIPVCLAVNMSAVRQANYDTACELANRAGFDDRMRTYIDFSYGRISEDQADQRFAELDEAEQNLPTEVQDAELAEIYQRYVSA